MITNGTAEPQSYYRIKFNGLPYDLFEYGATALDAIATARAETVEAGFDTETPLTLGNATARLAVYKEWNNSTWRYRNDGGFIRGECQNGQHQNELEMEQMSNCNGVHENLEQIFACADCVAIIDADIQDN